MSRFWSPVVGTLSPYVPGEQPKLRNLVKLNTNEHPYGPSPRVLEAIRGACDDTLKLYPDPSSDSLRQAIADNCGVRPEQVFVGNGSDEVLAHVFWRCSSIRVRCAFPTSATASIRSTAACTASTMKRCR